MICYNDTGLSGSVPSNRKLLGLIAASVQSVQVNKYSLNYMKVKHIKSNLSYYV